MQLRTIAIVQARMGSSRLPGKVLLDIAGEPMLVRVVERVRRAGSVDLVVVATTTGAEDNPLADLCLERGYPVYRGSLHDVLDRFYQAARAHLADVVVRITADCPLIDPHVIDDTVQAFLSSGVDFAANRLPPPWQRTYPIGLDVEVCTFEALEKAWENADQAHEREHVMPFLYAQEGRFNVLLVDHEPDFGSLRWTVDTAEDLELVRQIYARFPGRDDFSWKEVLDLVLREPELSRINAQVRHKSVKEIDHRSP